MNSAAEATVTYFLVDIQSILAYFYLTILGWIHMRTPHARRNPGAAEPERLLQARLPADLVKALRIHALERETTVKELLTRMIREHLTRERSRAGRTR